MKTRMLQKKGEMWQELPEKNWNIKQGTELQHQKTIWTSQKNPKKLEKTNSNINPKTLKLEGSEG